MGPGRGERAAARGGTGARRGAAPIPCISNAVFAAYGAARRSSPRNRPQRCALTGEQGSDVGHGRA